MPRTLRVPAGFEDEAVFARPGLDQMPARTSEEFRAVRRQLHHKDSEPTPAPRASLDANWLARASGHGVFPTIYQSPGQNHICGDGIFNRYSATGKVIE